MSSPSTFSDKIVVFPSVDIDTQGPLNPTNKLINQFTLQGQSGVKITYARVYASIYIVQPLQTSFPSAKIKFDGLQIGTVSWNIGDSSEKIVQIPINMTLGQHFVEIDVDGDFQALNFNTYLDIYYEATSPVTSGEVTGAGTNAGNPASNPLSAAWASMTPNQKLGVEIGGGLLAFALIWKALK